MQSEIFHVLAASQKAVNSRVLLAPFMEPWGLFTPNEISLVNDTRTDITWY